MKSIKLVIVAQTPPPYLGQSIMHKYFVDDKWGEIEKKHINLELTKESRQFGKFSVAKVIGVLNVIYQLWKERINGRIDILYYPPSGPANRKTFYKDLIILLFTRFLATKTVFHFHADKFNNLLTTLNSFELYFANIIYGKPDLCIVLLEIQKNDVIWLNPKRIVVIPNGIEDALINKLPKSSNNIFSVLYVGLLVGYKGIEDAVLASSILKNEGFNFKWVFVGGWSSVEFQLLIEGMIKSLNLHENLFFVGEKNDDQKWKYFHEADVLCLPTRNDLMPLCILEGMMMSLPIISTTIRTIPFIVDHEINGLLSPMKDPNSLAENLKVLIKNRVICNNFGINSRQKFESNYHILKHLQHMKVEILKLIK